MKAIWVIVVAIGPILDIVVWRRRQLGLLIYYFELLPALLYAAMPQDYGSFTVTLSFVYFLYFFMVMGANTRGHACSCILTYTVCLLLIHPYLFNEELTFWPIYFKLINVLSLVLCVAVFSAITTYIARIEARLKRLLL